MKRSTERILTTHTGSLPRPPDLAAALLAANGSREEGEQLREQVRAAVDEAVQRQVAAGIDVISDGEMGKPGFAHYVKDRLSGFQGPAAPRRFAPRDLLDFPEVAQRLFVSAGKELPRPAMPTNDGPIAYIGWDQLAADLDALSAEVENQAVGEAFLPAVSPGCVAMLMGTTHYPSRRDFLYALAEALAEEYRAIVSRGFVLQVDCPDLALGRHLEFADAPISEFRAEIELHVEVLNRALAGIDPEWVRIHVCWGNYPGPHHHDVPLAEILDVLYRVNANGLSIEGANPRHEHEWAVFAEIPPPPDKVLIPGVIDTCTNAIEHPETVAQRIERYASVVGRERVIAGTDCGFATIAGRSAVVPEVAFAKLASLAQGARLASARLW
ncbi:MAG TPA: cobalamin-independent methionine synthase II family protein [Thermomicrobiales bacterium]|nr:cobalamin-independent methionine synthase II family protein [Thermomicrobiales bacterium]